MLSVNFPAGFNRLNPWPLDVSAVFDTLTDLTTYLTPPTVAYPGQIVAVLAGGAAAYIIQNDMTPIPLGEGGFGFGVFWFEHDSGDLYFVSPSGATNPFEYDPATGNLYFIIA